MRPPYLPGTWEIRRHMAYWWALRNGIRADAGGWLRKKVYGPRGGKQGPALALGYGSLYQKYRREIWAEFDAWTEGRIR